MQPATIVEESPSEDLPAAGREQENGASGQPEQQEKRSSRGFFGFGSKSKEVPA